MYFRGSDLWNRPCSPGKMSNWDTTPYVATGDLLGYYRQYTQMQHWIPWGFRKKSGEILGDLVSSRPSSSDET